MAVAARFFVQSVMKTATQYSAVVLAASTRGEENKEWSHYTPSGSITINVKAGPAADWFEANIGRDVSVRFDDID